METQKIINCLNSPENEYSKFATKIWYVICSESKGGYLHHDPIKFLTNSIEACLCDYSDACILETDGTFVDYADFINTAMPMYNLIEYSDNYSDISRSLWGFKSDEVVNNADVTNNDNGPSVKYKASLITDTEANGTKNGIKIAVPLKYLSKFWRSLEMPLINCRVKLSLGWIENCVLTTTAIGANANAAGADSATFKITD